MSRTKDRRRGFGSIPDTDIPDADEVIKNLENGNTEDEVEEVNESLENGDAVVDREEAQSILGAFDNTPEEDIAKEYDPVLEEIKQDEIIDGTSDDDKEEVKAGNVDQHATAEITKEETPSLSDVQFGSGITKNIDVDKATKTLGGRMRTTKLAEILMGKMPKVTNGRNLANFRGLQYILEPQDILKFVGEAINEFNPEAKLAIDRIKASTIVSTILQTTDNIDEGKESRTYVMNRMALEMTGLGFNQLKDLKDGQIDVVVLQLPRKGYTTQGDPENIIGGALKKDYVKAGTILEEFGIITPTRYVPATLFTGDDNLRIDGGIQVFTDLYKMALICTCNLYNIFALTDALGATGGKVAIEVGKAHGGTYEVMTYLNKGNIGFVK